MIARRSVSRFLITVFVLAQQRGRIQMREAARDRHMAALILMEPSGQWQRQRVSKRANGEEQNATLTLD